MKDRSKKTRQLRFSQIPLRSEDYVDSVLNMSADDVERLKPSSEEAWLSVVGRNAKSSCIRFAPRRGRQRSRWVHVRYVV